MDRFWVPRLDDPTENRRTFFGIGPNLCLLHRVNGIFCRLFLYFSDSLHPYSFTYIIHSGLLGGPVHKVVLRVSCIVNTFSDVYSTTLLELLLILQVTTESNVYLRRYSLRGCQDSNRYPYYLRTSLSTFHSHDLTVSVLGCHSKLFTVPTSLSIPSKRVFLNTSVKFFIPQKSPFICPSIGRTTNCRCWFLLFYVFTF